MLLSNTDICGSNIGLSVVSLGKKTSSGMWSGLIGQVHVDLKPDTAVSGLAAAVHAGVNISKKLVFDNEAPAFLLMNFLPKSFQ